MTRKEKRLAIVKDVLSRLRYRKIDTNFYVNPFKALDLAGIDLDLNAKNLPLEKCQTCALGSMLISHVRVYNKLSLRDLGFCQSDECSLTRSDCTGVLSNYFDADQLTLIEFAFEGYRVFDINVDGASEAIKFGKKFKHPKTRLRAIMNNILENDGTFKP